PSLYIALPESLQTRFETIIHPDVGSEIERQSGEGRIQGFFTGLELWAANPLTGVGPGAWRPATGSVIESHNLFGQLVGETGTLGLAAFLFVLFSFHRNLSAMRRLRRQVPAMEGDFAFQVSQAVVVAGSGSILSFAQEKSVSGDDQRDLWGRPFQQADIDDLSRRLTNETLFRKLLAEAMKDPRKAHADLQKLPSEQKADVQRIIEQ